MKNAKGAIIAAAAAGLFMALGPVTISAADSTIEMSEKECKAKGGQVVPPTPMK